MKQEELKACPFCGYDDISDEELGTHGYRYCACNGCGSASFEGTTKREGIENWNSRPVENSLARERDEARAIARKLYAENKRLKAYIEADRQQALTDGRSR